MLILASFLDAVHYAEIDANFDYEVEPVVGPTRQYLHNDGSRYTNGTIGSASADFFERFFSGGTVNWTQIPAMSSDTTFYQLYSRLYMDPQSGAELKINGTTGSQAGWNVTMLDINGDGYSDIVVGAPDYDSGRGAVYIFFGYSGIFENSPLDPADANVTIIGREASANFGWSVRNISAWHDTGHDALAVGAPGNDSVHIFYGNSSSNWGSTWDLSTTPANVTLYSTAGEGFGLSVGGKSNMNWNGYSDLIVGAPNWDSARGRAYVFYGGSGQPSVISTGDADMIINGSATGDHFGFSVASAGNVNSTAGGYRDFIVGAPFSNNTGRAYIFYDNASLSGKVWWDLSVRNANVTLAGETDGDLFGWSVFAAGDVNGDSYGDVVVGAPGYNSGGGRAYVYFGGEDMDNGGTATSGISGGMELMSEDDDGEELTSTRSSSSLTDQRSAADEPDTRTRSGSPVPAEESAEIVREPVRRSTSREIKASSLVYVTTSGTDFVLNYPDGSSQTIISNDDEEINRAPEPITPTALEDMNPFLYGNATNEDRFGWNISYADINNDGYNDMLVGAPTNNSADGSKTDTGAVYVFFGYGNIASGDIFPSSANVTIYGTIPDGQFGWDVDAAGEVNETTKKYEDIVVGCPGSDKGNAYIIDGWSILQQSTDEGGDGIIYVDDVDVDIINITGESSGDKFGASVAGVGDTNGDGYDDVVFGAPYNDNGDNTDAGAVYILEGSGSLQSTYSAGDEYLTKLISTTEPIRYMGFSVAGAGDVDNDGYTDVIIGAPGVDKAYIYHGSSTGLAFTNTNTTVEDFNRGSYYRTRVKSNATEPPAGNGDVLLDNKSANEGASDVDGKANVYNETLSSGGYSDTKIQDGQRWDIYENETDIPGPKYNETLRPDGSGDENTWSSGIYSDVNDQDDGTYLVSDITGNWQEALFSCADHVTGSGEINWVRTYIRYRNGGGASGTEDVRTSIKSGTTESDGDSLGPLTSAIWADAYTEYNTNPDTGFAWTWNEIDSVQIGADGKGYDGPGGNDGIPHVSEVWLVVNYTTSGGTGYAYDVEFNFTNLEISDGVNYQNKTTFSFYGYEEANDCNVSVWNNSASDWEMITSIDIPRDSGNEAWVNDTTNLTKYIFGGRLVIRLNKTADSTQDAWVHVDYLGLRFDPYAPNGTYHSSVYDTGTTVSETTVSWEASNETENDSTTKILQDSTGSSRPEPFYVTDSAARIQILYEQSLIDSRGIIDKIYWLSSDSDTGTFGTTSPLKFYLSHCSASRTSLSTNFNDNYDGFTPTRVYRVGNKEITGAGTGNWLEFDIENTFTYNNINNLILEVRWEGSSGSTPNTYAATSTDHQLWAWGSENDTTGTVYDYQHSMKFDIITEQNNFNISVSSDGGTTWDDATSNGGTVQFTNPGTQLQFKAEFYLRNHDYSPVLHSVTLTVPADTTTLLGDNETDFGWSVEGGANSNNDDYADVMVGAPVRQGSSTTIFYDNFDTDKGWTLELEGGEWQRTAPQGLGGSGGDPDPNTAYSGTNVLGVDLTGLGSNPGDYEPNLARTYWATSPVIDLNKYTGIELQFQRWLGVETSSYDHAYIEVYDGSAWQQIWSNEATMSDGAWIYIQYDVSQYADNNPAFQIRFGLGTTDGSVQYCGWNIDDLYIIGTYDYPQGRAYLFNGTSQGILQANGRGTANVTFTGAQSGDNFSYSLSMGDNNGDNYDDIIIGAPYNATDTGTTTGAGAVYVFNGSASLSSSYTAVEAGYVHYGPGAGNYTGWSVAHVGYIGDIDPIAVGSPGWYSWQGNVTVVTTAMGGTVTVTFRVTTINAGDTLTQTNAINITIGGTEYWLWDGHDVSGNFNKGTSYYFNKTNGYGWNSSADHRWIRRDSENPDAPSGSLDAGDNNGLIEVYYYEQWQVTFAATTVNAGTQMDSSNNATVTYTANGTGSQTVNPYDGVSYSRWVDNTTGYSYSSESTGSSTEHRWYEPTPPSASVITASSTITGEYYEQWWLTFTASTINTGTAMDASNYATVTYTANGTGSQTVEPYDGTSYSRWVDNTTGYSYSSESSGSTTEHRWYEPTPPSASNILTSETITGEYYEQWWLTFTASTMNTGTAMDASNYATVTYTANGTGSQTVNPYDGTSYSRWVDNTTGYSYSSESSGSTTEHRWFEPSPPSANNIFTSQEITGEYYEQWWLTFSASTINAGTQMDASNYATVTYTANGTGSQTVNPYDGTSYSRWIDNTTGYSYSQLSSSSSGTHRWYEPSPPSASTITASSTITGEYYEQWWLTFAASTINAGTQMDASNYVTVTYTSNGTGSQTVNPYDGVSYSRWVDNTTGYSYSSESSGSTTEHRWYEPTPPSASTITTSETITGEYYEQWWLTFSASTINAGTQMDASNYATVTYTSNGTGSQTVNPYDGTSYSRWVDNTTGYSYSSDSSSSSTEHRWYEPSPPSASTITTSETITGEYYEQWWNSFTANTVGNDNLDSGNYAEVDYLANGTWESAGGSKIQVWDGETLYRWVDNSTSNNVNYSALSSASNSNHRWFNPTPRQFTSQFKNGYDETYYEQWWLTFAANTVNTGTTMSSGNTSDVSLTSNGTVEHVYPYDGVAYSRWVDNGTGYSYSSLSTGSTTEHRWYEPTPPSAIVITASGTITGEYYEQWWLTFAANTVNAGTTMSSGNTSDVTYTANGTADQHVYPYDGVSYKKWVDNTSGYSYSSLSTGSTPEHRWYEPTPPSATNIFTSTTITGEYYEQWNVTFKYNDVLNAPESGNIPVSYTHEGSVDTGYGTESGNWYWADNGTAYDYTNPHVVTADEERWYSESTNVTGTISASQTISPDYYHQYFITVYTTGGYLNVTYSSTLYWYNISTQYSTTIYDGISPIQRWMDDTTTFNVSTPVQGPTSPRNVKYICDNNASTVSGSTVRRFLFHAEFPPDMIITGSGSLGWSVSGGGDYNTDSKSDVVIGAPDGTGSAYVFFGNSSWDIGTEISTTNANHTFTGENTGDKFGWSVNGPPADVNDNGNSNFIVGAPDWGGKGRSYVYELGGSPVVDLEFVSNETGAKFAEATITLDQDAGWYNQTIDLNTESVTISQGYGIVMWFNVSATYGMASVDLYYDSSEYPSRYEFSTLGTVGNSLVSWVKTYRDTDTPTDQWRASYSMGETVYFKANVTADENTQITAADITIQDAYGNIIIDYTDMGGAEDTGATWKLYNYSFDTSTLSYGGLYKAIVRAEDDSGFTDADYGETNSRMVWFWVEE